ncbi:MAG: septum formation initiator family protein, partial [Gemmatimonadaceae bacterium]
MATKTQQPKWRALLNRVLVLVAVCALAWFAVEGGEYGTRAVFAQHARRDQLDVEVKALHQEVDSLAREKTAVLKNDTVLERIAREQYGMLRGNKEVLYWMN